jgi:3-deoxy-D-manno-octulosonate 8-phosphate phosphatase (KDO 8-P phosphatase)
MLSAFKTIRNFVFDMDGVLTDGTLLILENGLMARRMSIKDGYALQLAVKKGYKVIIISGGNSPEVITRLNKLGITEVFMGVENKKKLLEEYLSGNDLDAAETLCMGDDIPDLSVLQMVGLPACPADAVLEIKAVCQYISPFAGGAGCVRDVIEKVLKLNHHWDTGSGLSSI